MNPDRWQQIGQIYHAAMELAPEARVDFLAGACGGDDELRREVESLLGAHDKAGDYFAAPAVEVAAGLAAQQKNPSLIGHSLNHYQVLSLLGAGGMGEVYLAQDTSLGRKVALKLLPAEFTKDPDRVRRFKQEARAASALNHPNIITIYEIGETQTEAGGLHFIATEFIDGQTLRERMKQHPPKLAESLDVALQVASALAAAHEAGIVHRDIKPENVMARKDGLVKVLDFGLAKPAAPRVATGGSDAPTAPQISTQSGMVIGTVAYMSPEQARGLKVDRRTDIFSLGVMLYEMLAGRRPFEGATMSDAIAALLSAEPPPLGQLCAEAPAELEQIVGKCLAKDREDRRQTAEELIAELKAVRHGSQAEGAVASRRIEATGAKFASWRWPVVAAIAAMLIVGLVYFLVWRRAPAVQPDQIKSLAVLPLENLSGDPAQEYFADGMTEALISNLSQVRALRVISRTSVMRFKDSRQPLAEIARELNVDAVIEGSVQRAGGRVKITARLIRAADENLLRSFDYEHELADVLKLQSEVARAVTNEIRIQVTAEERARLASARRVNPEAHEAYLLGRYHLRRQNEAELKLAIGHFERATQLDADYAAAWAGLSIAWLQRGLFGATSFREVEQPAREAALKALAADANSAEGYTALAIFKNRYEWDWAGSEHDFRRAIDLNPGSVEAHRFFAFLLSALGRHDEAISEIQTAEKLDPLSSLVQSDLGVGFYRARKYEQAEWHLKRAIDLDPLNYGAYGRLGSLYGEMGRYADAIARLEKAETQQGGAGGAGSDRGRRYAANLALVYARMGRREEALQMLEELRRTIVPVRFPKEAAAVWAALGNKDEAFRLLFDAVEKRAEILIFMKIDSSFDSLHSDPRWKELLRPMNFPDG